MDINNPKEITYIKEIDGETIRPEALNDTELAALTAETEGVGWKKDSDGHYYLPSGLADVSGNVLRMKMFTVSNWNMGVSNTKNVATGIHWNKWRGITVSIIGDTFGPPDYDIVTPGDAGTRDIVSAYHENGVDNERLTLEIKVGGYFDAAFYADPGTRAYVILFYEP